MTPEKAIEIVARQALAEAVEDLAWEDYPEIGEHDWERVLDAAADLAQYPVGYLAAYELLEARAEHSEHEPSDAGES